MNDFEFQAPRPILLGEVMDATYRDPVVSRYRGNPVIEALPEILSAERAADLMSFYPERQPDAHKLPAEIRMHLIMDALHFFEPLPVHIDIEQRISRVVRDGYVGRNPASTNEWRDLDRRVTSIQSGRVIPLRTSSMNGFSVVGIPGIGKTTGVERVLQLYPQVIRHQNYKGVLFNRIQLVWLKLTCPHDGSIKSLCLDFFREVDAVLGTNYMRDYAGTGRRTVDELIPAMARVAGIHCLGLFAIDEIQHLNQAKSGGAERMLNFFLQLMNTLGVPVLLIGTYGALPVLSRELRQIRRCAGQGDLIWDRMANDGIWTLFVESLWRYQYTATPVPLNKELSDCIYEESAGIVDFAGKLFLLAQVRAITAGTEKITPQIIRSVASDSLKLAQPALRAIRTGDMRAVATMTDLHPIDFQSAVQSLRRTTLLKALPQGTEIVSELNQAAAPPTENPSPDARPAIEIPISGNTVSAPRNSPKKAKKSADTCSNCLLVETTAAGIAQKKSAHASLLQAGQIATWGQLQREKTST